MKTKKLTLWIACWVLGIATWIPATAQTSISSQPSPGIAAPSRVTEAVDDMKRMTLPGNTHPLAQTKYDKGLVDPSLLLERMVLVLKRSPEQEQALHDFNERQYDTSSPDFHHWLDPEEFGHLYGPSDEDIAAITGWLQSHGFTVGNIGKGRVSLEFTGSVAQVQDAFRVEMHNYLVNGEAHIANDRDPQIPVALSPVIDGILSLHNFFPKHHAPGGQVRRDLKTGKYTPVEDGKSISGNSGSGPRPMFGFTDGNGYNREDVTPYDFATIYNLLPLWNASTPINGKGVTIALAGGSDVNNSDFNTFRSSFGLPATTLQYAHNGADPGIVTGSNSDQGENTLDVEWSGATAPGATILLVSSSNTSTSYGFELSEQYVIDNKLAPIMSASYGICELSLGSSGNTLFNNLHQQGATEGISIFVSAMDVGSAGCSTQNGTTPYADSNGLQVNGIASSPYQTAVGGTDLNWEWWTPTGYETYWNSTADSHGATAKGYIPEVTWNSSCSSVILQTVFGISNAETLCNDALKNGEYYDVVSTIGGSGGYSHCTTPTGTTSATCSGGYAKPSWQTGTGVPADGKRDLPDISFFASFGFSDPTLPGSTYLMCISSTNSDGCNYTNNEYVVYQENGGTSAASPAMAGVMALIVQKSGGAWQGLANPALYALAAKQTYSNCSTNSVTTSSSCYFNDIVEGSNAMVCITGDPNCTTSTTGDEVGILSGYGSNVGYDLTNGLGSLNVANVVAGWSAVTGAPTVALSPTSLTFASTPEGTETAAQTVTLKNTGNAPLTIASSGIAFTGTNATSFVQTATTCGSSVAAGSSCTISVAMDAKALGSLTAALSVTDNASGSPQTVKLTGTATAPAVTLSPTSLTFASTPEGTETAAQTVTLKNTGNAPLTIASSGIAFTGTNATSFVQTATTCGSSVAAGSSCTISVAMDAKASGSLTAALSVTDNASGSPQTVKLTGTATTAAAVTLSPTSLSFAAQAEGTVSIAQFVTLTNSGGTALSITSIAASGNYSETNTCGTSVAAGAKCTISVTFSPAATGTLTGTITIKDSAPNSPQTVSLTGAGTTAVTFTPATLTFPATVTATASPVQAVTLKNASTVTISLGTPAFSGTSHTSFAALTSCGASLAAGGSCSYYIASKPASTGSLTATFSVPVTGAAQPSAVSVNGTGAAAPAVKLSTTSISFPTTTHATTSPVTSVTVTNSGSVNLNLTGIAITGTNATSFVQLNNCPAQLAASASCTIYTAFAPSAAGSFTATLQFADNGASSPQSVALKGTGK